MAIHVVKEPVPKPGTLGRTELYALAIGQVIGAGVITLIVPAIKMTGYSAWLAYFVAILMGFVMILPFVFISSTRIFAVAVCCLQQRLDILPLRSDAPCRCNNILRSPDSNSCTSFR